MIESQVLTANAKHYKQRTPAKPTVKLFTLHWSVFDRKRWRSFCAAICTGKIRFYCSLRPQLVFVS